MSADQNTDTGHSGPKQPRPKHSGAQTDVSPEATSKSARKREADRLLLLGRRLTELRHEHLDTLELPDALLQALLDYQRFPSHGAKKRQLQFIGKIMRSIDVEAIEAALAKMDGESAEARYQFKQLEQWRDLLISDENALTTFIEAFPNVDRQQLRQLIKKANDARNETQQKTHARALFRFIRDTADA